MSKRFVCSLLAVVFLAAIPGASAAEDAPSATAAVAIDFDPPCLNGLVDTCNITAVHWLMGTTLAGAYRVRPDFSFEPVLVERVEVETDPFALTYSIKPEAVWSDGTAVSADDFIFTLETLRDPANTTAIARSRYERVSSAERIDAKTFRLLFDRPMPHWQSLFSIVLPKHVLDGYDFDEVWRTGIADPSTGAPIGSGPFLLTARSPGASLTVTPNPRWWGGSGPFLDAIVFQVVESAAAQLQGVRDGILDLVFPQPQLGIDDIRGAEGVVVEWTTGTVIEHIDFNVTSTTMPLLRESWFRRAVAFALDREGAAAAVYEWLVPDYPALQNLSYDPVQAEYEPSFGGYSFDPDAVEEIMLGQGCVTAPDGIWSCGGVRASVKFATVTGNQERAKAQQFLIARAQAAGIELVADNDSGSVLFGTRLPARQYELIFFAWVRQIGASPLPLYGCAGAQNFLGYCSAAVDELLLQAEDATDLTTRGELLGDAYDLIAADMPTIPLLARPVFLVRRDRLRGPQVSPGGIETWNVEEWRIGGDETPPETTANASPAPNASGWNDETVTVSLAASDEDSGVKELRYTLAGAQAGGAIVDGSTAAVAISAEGITTIEYYAVDAAGNAEAASSLVVRVDKTAPKLDCVAQPSQISPANHKLVPVRIQVQLSDALSGAGGFVLVHASSDEPAPGDIRDFAVGTHDTSGRVRAERSAAGDGRTYTFTYAGTDLAGNEATCAARVDVPLG